MLDQVKKRSGTEKWEINRRTSMRNSLPAKALRENHRAEDFCLRSSQQSEAKGLGKSHREAVDGNLKGWSGRWTSIGGKTLPPTQTPVGSLCSALHILTYCVLCLLWLNEAKCHDDRLRAQERQERPPNLAARPISPENGEQCDRCRWRGCNHHL